MRHLLTLAATVAAVTTATAADVKSGPAVGSPVPGPFEPLHLTGPDAGDEACFYCKFGNGPVVMVFARTASPGLAALVAKIESAAVEHRGARLGTCVIFLDTSDAAKTAARKLGDALKLRETVLACVEPEKVKDYGLAADADVTVLLYSRRTVRAVHALKAGEITAEAVGRVAADLPKILPAK